MLTIDADYVLDALGIFSDREHGEPHFLNGIETAREIVEQAPTVGGWISVEDELPKLGDMVLFTGLSSFGTRFTTQRGWFDGTFWKRNAGETVYSNTPVTHWMPLPEPPKEGDGR